MSNPRIGWMVSGCRRDEVTGDVVVLALCKASALSDRLLYDRFVLVEE